MILLSMAQDSSVEDFGALSREISTHYLDSASTPIDVILDMTHLERFPYQLFKLRSVVSDLFQHPALGRIMMVGRVNPLAGCIIDTLARTFDVECVQIPNREDALALVTRTTVQH
ncbi:MAG: hypothetical protein K8J31_01335 [Anaerolineae bacterium]|nr:hypothetical protein [Anaerolineae bacterium]